MCRVKPDVRFPMSIQRLSCWCFLAAMFLSGWFAVNSRADYSNRRQIIVFTTPESESGKAIQRSVGALRCQLVDRDTDVRFVDVSELPDAGATPTIEQSDTHVALAELARLRSDERSDFEMVLIGKDGGVKARARDLSALEDFLTLIDSMPMRRAEMRSRDSIDDGCERNKLSPETKNNRD